MAGKTAFVFGASGLTGSLLMKELLRNTNYDKVILVVRRPLVVIHPKAQEIFFDNFELFDISNFSVEDVHVFCCLGTTIKQAGSQEAFRKVDFELPFKIAEWARQHEIRTFVVVSSIGADFKSRNFYLRTKGEMEEGIISLSFPRLYILRPSFLIGARNEFRIGEEIVKIFSGLLKYVLFGPLKKYRPIEASNVAKAMIKLANSNEKEIFYESDQIELLSSK